MIIFSMFFINNINVHAETANFYEGEYIDGIYMNKYQYSTKTIFYQKARFFRKSGTNEFAYCIEPFSFFEDNKNYQSTVNPYNLTKNQIDRISKIAYFGYGYKNHMASKWYAITQLMIWQAADSGGDYYFTDSLNGNRTNYYSNEMNEIERLIDDYDRLPSMSNKNYTLIRGNNMQLYDYNDVLKYYKTDNPEISIIGNTINLENLELGEYTISLTRTEDNYHKPLIFYQSTESQNLIKTGDLNKKQTSFTVDIMSTSITVVKVDKDTMTVHPSGEANLDGAIFTLYDSNMNELMDFEIVNNQYIIGGLNFGIYYIKEKLPGEGYTLNDTVYEVKIDKENNNEIVITDNEVIKKKIVIEKKYGAGNSFQGEKNIDFDIFNKDGALVKTISTNDQGIVEIILPFGEYTFIQKNTTKGYTKVSPFKINIEDQEEEKIELKDYKIPVPNTHTSYLKNLLLIILGSLLIFIC